MPTKLLPPLIFPDLPLALAVGRGMKASTAAAFLTSKWRVLQQSRRRQYGYAFVERWEKATLVHGFLMESKPGEAQSVCTTTLGLHCTGPQKRTAFGAARGGLNRHSEAASLLIKLTRKCVLAMNR